MEAVVEVRVHRQRWASGSHPELPVDSRGAQTQSAVATVNHLSFAQPAKSNTVTTFFPVSNPRSFHSRHQQQRQNVSPQRLG